MAFTIDTTDLLEKPILQGLQASSATAVHDVGYTVRGANGREYKYVYYESSDVPMYSGAPGVWVDTTASYVVTSDLSDTGTQGEGFAGVFCMKNLDVNNTYCWIQTKGRVDDACVSLLAIAVNDLLYAGPENVFEDVGSVFTSILESTFNCVAVALTAGAGGESTYSLADIMLL